MLINDADWELLVSTSGTPFPNPPLAALVRKAFHEAWTGRRTLCPTLASVLRLFSLPSQEEKG